MRLRRLAILQWAGLFGGGIAWACAHVFGYAIQNAECGANRAAWSMSNDAWEASLLGVSMFFVLVAEAAAIAVLRGTASTTYDDDDPPASRIRFLAIAAAVSNVIFFAIIVFDLLGTLFNVACRGS